MKWTHACGSNLTDENLYYLACKAFRNNNLPQNLDDINQLVLTWPLFCKDALPDRNFTFWEWFYRILILTQTHMQKLWMEGFVKGFITKQAAESLLMNKPSGTFLLRFSDSELGGVTIAYVRKPDVYRKYKYIDSLLYLIVIKRDHYMERFYIFLFFFLVQDLF